MVRSTFPPVDLVIKTLIEWLVMRSCVFSFGGMMYEEERANDDVEKREARTVYICATSCDP